MNSGDRIGAKYIIRGKLGQGGTANVYLVENLVLENLWAMKAIDKHNPGLNDFKSEVQLLKGLNHPMLPRVADLLEDEHYLYIFMDYIEGTTLEELMKSRGLIDEATAIQWASALLDVLHYLHNYKPTPIIYRDLKPANIMLDASGNLHLIDFGAATRYHQEATGLTTYLGTRGYAAPEQYGTGRADARTDLYNWAMTLLFLITGIHPTQINVEQVRKLLLEKGFSKNFSEILYLCIQQEPSKRVQSAEECLALLKRHESQPKGILGGLIKKERLMPKIEIGIMGACQGAGCTFTALSLAGYFTKKGYKAVILEHNESGDFSRLESIFLMSNKLSQTCDAHFSAHGITFYKSITDSMQVSRKAFDVFIHDLGTASGDAKLKIFSRADIKLVACPSTDWKIDKTKDFLEVYGSFDTHQEWFYSILSPDIHEERYLKYTYPIENTITFPLMKNPFMPAGDEVKKTETAINRLLSFSGLK